MTDNTQHSESSQDADTPALQQATDPTSLQSKLDRCDTLLDQLVDQESPGVSSKETPPQSTAYPEFGTSAEETVSDTPAPSLTIQICRLEIGHSAVQQLRPGEILSSSEPVDQWVELLWNNLQLGTGKLRIEEDQYVIEIVEFNYPQPQELHYDI